MKKKVIREPDMLGGTIKSFPMFGSVDTEQTPPRWDTRVTISQGGWAGRRWMTSMELNTAIKRWTQHSCATGVKAKTSDWIPYQCGGCRFFGAFDSDFGLCCNPASANDGRVVFEHGGCPVHSAIQEGPAAG